MKTRFMILFTLMTACGCGAQPATPAASTQSRATRPSSPFEGAARVELKNSVVTVPLTKSAEFYFADVLLNGQRFRFTLETGAGIFAISSRAAATLGLRADTLELMPGSRSAVVRIDSLNLGGVVLYDLVARVSETLDGRDFDGLISIPFFRGVLGTIDLGSSRLLFTRGSLPPVNGADVLAISGKDRGGRVDFEMNLGGTRTYPVLDSRSFLWLVAPDSLSSLLRLENAPRSLGNAWGPSMGTFELRAARMAEPLRIGSTIIERPVVAFRARPGVVVGVPFMEQFVITIDLQNSRVRLARPAGAGTVVVPPQEWESGAAGEPARRAAAPGGQPTSGQRTMGFGLAGPPGGGQLNIVNVLPQSGAAKVGIREGDQLLELDGTHVSRMSPAVVRAAVAKGTAIKVVVLRAGQQIEFNVEPYVVP